MVTISAGDFLYGTDKSPVEHPTSFKIDKTEVTVAAYGKCVDAGICHVPDSDNDRYNWKQPGRENNPVNGVNWDDAKTYCEWAGKRLPTGAEWEKAARGADGRTYPWGENEPTCERTIMEVNGIDGCGKDRTWPVCSKPEGNTPEGLCDMAGNVREWTDDLLNTNDIHKAFAEPVLRGGSWDMDDAKNFGAAGRIGFDRAKRSDTHNGFRCAQDAPAETPSEMATQETPPAVQLNPVPAEMVTIPAGSFLYGDDRKPVSLPAFKIDKSEVTVADYGKCVQAGKCAKPDSRSTADNWGKPGRERHPVNDVNWDDAATYCEWAGKRLPSEQEWEKAARGMDGRTYPWGEQEPTCSRTVISQAGDGCGRFSTWPVCSKPSGNSPYELCDMVGNVWEWTDDPDVYKKEIRVLRGGGWSWSVSDSEFFRPSYGWHHSPDSTTFNFGFRCAQDASGGMNLRWLPRKLRRLFR